MPQPSRSFEDYLVRRRVLTRINVEVEVANLKTCFLCRRGGNVCSAVLGKFDPISPFFMLLNDAILLLLVLKE